MVSQTMFMNQRVFSVLCRKDYRILNRVCVEIYEVHLVWVHFFLIDTTVNQQSITEKSWGMRSDSQGWSKFTPLFLFKVKNTNVWVKFPSSTLWPYWNTTHDDHIIFVYVNGMETWYDCDGFCRRLLNFGPDFSIEVVFVKTWEWKVPLSRTKAPVKYQLILIWWYTRTIPFERKHWVQTLALQGRDFIRGFGSHFQKILLINIY